MKHFFILLVFAASFAHAQPAQWPVVGKTTGFITGKHGTADDGHRWAAWRYLSADGFRWVPYVAVLRRDKVLNYITEIPGEPAEAYLNRMWAANTPLPCADTAIKSICDTAWDALAKTTEPEPPRFVVAKNGASLTRPMYSYNITTKAVGAVVKRRATVGDPCACWAYGVKQGTTNWCIVPNAEGTARADEVAACVRQ